MGDWEILTGTVKAATLDTGARISHTEFLRMACPAQCGDEPFSTSFG